MEIYLKYFGSVAEKVGTSEETIQLQDESPNLLQLKNFLFEKYDLNEEDSIRIAVNENIITDINLQDGDIIALLPPFAGG